MHDSALVATVKVEHLCIRVTLLASVGELMDKILCSQCVSQKVFFQNSLLSMQAFLVKSGQRINVTRHTKLPLPTDFYCCMYFMKEPKAIWCRSLFYDKIITLVPSCQAA